VIGERIGERAAFYSQGRMDHHARRLDHYDQVFVFVDDFERYWFGTHRGERGVLESYLHEIISFDMVTCARCNSIHKAGTLAQKTGDTHTAQPAKARPQKLIQPAARFFAGDAKLKILNVSAQVSNLESGSLGELKRDAGRPFRADQPQYGRQVGL